MKSLFQNRTPHLSLKYILIQVHDQEGKQAKWKNSVKNQRPNRKEIKKTQITVRQGNRKQRRWECNTFYPDVQATPDHVYCRYCRTIYRSRLDIAVDSRPIVGRDSDDSRTTLGLDTVHSRSRCVSADIAFRSPILHRHFADSSSILHRCIGQ